MEQFAQWFIDLMKKIVGNIWEGIVGFSKLIYQKLVLDFTSYIDLFIERSKTFNILDWLFSIIATVLLLLIFILLITLIVFLIKKYFRFVRIEKDKEELMEEVNHLSYELNKLLAEKNAKLALSKEDIKVNQKEEKEQKNRFSLLPEVDLKYNRKISQTIMKDEDKLKLNELVSKFIHYAASNLNLYYSEKTVRIFFAGMATSKTMILEGISGTGKTSLAYAMGKFFNHDASIISVQPSWRDRGEMLGYFNEFTKKFNETEFLKSLYEATYRTDLTFIVLDEMNLARVEYYFADFLSILEMPNKDEWNIQLINDVKSDDPYHLRKGKLNIPENVWFIGTANRDDSTFAITDKVYDRVASIEMNDKAVFFEANPEHNVHLSFDYVDNLFKEALLSYKISAKTLESLRKLDEYIIDNFQIAFGNRINKQIHTFIPVYMASGGNEIEALDYLVSRKIIRKFEALNLPFLQKELTDLVSLIDKLFGKTNFTDTKKMIKSYIKSF